jgi:hypothetical protein
MQSSYFTDWHVIMFVVGILEDALNVTVKDLLKVLYEKACQQKLWGLVRHTAGMLGKRVEDLAKALTDLLVRQKQVTDIFLLLLYPISGPLLWGGGGGGTHQRGCNL